MTYQYALLKGSEDGNPFKLLTPAELADLLANPADWGVAEFADLADMPTDPNYWPDRVAVLLKVEVVLPERVCGYMLPEPAPQAGHWIPCRADATPITLGKVLD
jgi:hypothetical protein